MGTWIFLGAFVAMLIGLYMGLKDGKRQVQRVSPAVPVHHWPTLEEFAFDIVGESNYQPTLKALRGDPDDPAMDGIGTALIVPENDNSYDNQAVKVMVQNLTIGYFAKEDARSFRKRLAAMKLGTSVTSCGVQITGGHTLRNGETAHFGARLDIKPFD